MPHARVPVKLNGQDIGNALVYDDGKIEMLLEPHHSAVVEVFHHIELGVIFGLSISPIINPGISGDLITRVDAERPLTEFGGFRIDEQREA